MTRWQRKKNCRRQKMFMCRACLVLLGEQDDDMYDMVNEKGLAIKFLECTSIVIELDDDMPKCICGSCYQLLHKFHDFQRMCAESMHNFRKLLKDTAWKDEQEINEEYVVAKGDDDVNANELTTQLQPQTTVDTFVGKIEEVYIISESDDAANLNNFLVPEEETVIKNDVWSTRRNKYVCHICNQSFYKVTLLEAHLAKHTNQHPYTCAICNKHFVRQMNLDQHLREIHSETTKYKCENDECSKVYQSQRSLTHHVRTTHNSKKIKISNLVRNFICDQCGKGFTRQANLTRHSYVHLSKAERPYACIHCEHRFYTKQFLLNHLNRHTGVKPFKCSDCGQLLTSRDDLTTHMNKHTRKKFWQCQECEKTFYNVSNFRAHKRAVHLGIKNHVCGFCEERFSKREHLVNHEMIHTGECRYICQYCKKRFIQLTPYKYHLRNVHHNEMYNKEMMVKTQTIQAEQVAIIDTNFAFEE